MARAVAPRFRDAFVGREGLRLLPAATVLTRQKQTRAVTATLASGIEFDAYEIHVGVTTFDAPEAVTPFARLGDGGGDGVWVERVIGTYLHGAFEHPDVCAAVFGLAPPAMETKADHYRRLAMWFERHQRNIGELGLV